MDKIEYLIEVDHEEVVKRIQFDLECAEKALKNAHINVLRLEREREAWLAKQRAVQEATGVVSSGPVNLNHIGSGPVNLNHIGSGTANLNHTGHSPAICTCPPVQFWDNYKGEPLQLAPCAVHGTNWVRF